MEAQLRATEVKLKAAQKKAPGGLSSWRRSAGAPLAVAKYPQQSRSRHLQVASQALVEVTQYDRSKQADIATLIYETFGPPGSDQQSAETLLAVALMHSAVRALASLKKNGRPTNHNSSVRAALLSVVADSVPEGMRLSASSAFGVSRRDLRAFSDALVDLDSGKKEQWFLGRGKDRAHGRFAKTNTATLELAADHWNETGVQGANKNDMVRSPSNREETKIKVYNYERIPNKYATFMALQRKEQHERWMKEASALADVLRLGGVLVTTLFRSKLPLFELYVVMSQAPGSWGCTPPPPDGRDT